MELRSSIGIFQRAVEGDDTTRPITPQSVFEAAEQVIQTKQTTIVRNKDGVYVISYSATGPFNDKVSEEWLPVQVMKLKQWSSGGIKASELQQFVEHKEIDGHSQGISGANQPANAIPAAPAAQEN